MNECKPLAGGGAGAGERGLLDMGNPFMSGMDIPFDDSHFDPNNMVGDGDGDGRGLHSSTFQRNLSRC